VFDPDAHMPRINRGMVYLGACLIAGIRLARERQVNVRVILTGNAIEESVDLAFEIFNRVGRCGRSFLPMVTTTLPNGKKQFSVSEHERRANPPRVKSTRRTPRPKGRDDSRRDSGRRR
jgi:hypothetical protein